MLLDIYTASATYIEAGVVKRASRALVFKTSLIVAVYEKISVIAPCHKMS
jgi:hypothetical protein